MNPPPAAARSPKKIDFALGLLRVVQELPRPLSIVRLRMLIALARHGRAMHGADLGRAVGLDETNPISGHIKNALGTGFMRVKSVPYGKKRLRRSYELTEEGQLFVRDFLAAADGYAVDVPAMASADNQTPNDQTVPTEGGEKKL